MTVFLLGSLVASIVLTVLLNLVLWVARARGGRSIIEQEPSSRPSTWTLPEGERSRVRLYVPWRLMLIASIVLTVLLNIVVRLR